jgi:hypothetical protein
MFVVALALVFCPHARSDDPAAMQIIDKAIKATYGNNDPAKHSAISWKGSGTLQTPGMPIGFTGEWTIQAPNQMKNKLNVEPPGMTVTIVQVINADKGWRSLMGQVSDLSDDDVKQAHEELYAGRIAALRILKDDKLTFKKIADLKDSGQTLVGLEATSPAHKPIQLYFNEKGLVTRVIRKTKDMMTGNEVDQETTYADFKAVDGVQRYHKMLIKRDGKDFLEMDITDYKLYEKLPDSTFSKPGE